MAAIVAVPASHTAHQNRAFSSVPYRYHTLLNLDCSSDLRRYSRSLGPNAQPRDTPIPALNSRPLRQPSPTRGHQQAPQLVGYANAHTHSRAPSQHSQPQPPLQQFAIAQPPPRQPAAPIKREESSGSNSDMEDDPNNTYPPVLRAMLERSRRRNEPPRDSLVYTVGKTTINFQGERETTIGSYHDMHTANVVAAKHFVEEYGNQFETGDPIFDLPGNGLMSLEIRTDRASGGHVSVFVKRWSVR